MNENEYQGQLKKQAEVLADAFELSEVETRIEFGLYSWIGSHCGVTDAPGVGCTW